MAVTIFIKNEKGQAYTVALDDTEFQGTTVLDLKKKIEALERIPVSQQQLIFNGRELNDNFLSYYGIRNASLIYANLRLRGGAEPGGPGDPGLGDKDGKNRMYNEILRLNTDTEFQGATVLDLKHKIAALKGTPEEQQRLIFNGRQLVDDFLLSHY